MSAPMPAAARSRPAAATGSAWRARVLRADRVVCWIGRLGVGRV